MSDAIEVWEQKIQSKMQELVTFEDPAHDLLHIRRVVSIAKHLCQMENASFEVVVPAAWLHDLINIPKNDSRRSQGSRLSADAAINLLAGIEYPRQYYSEIHHAIEAHSFSANVETKSLEAQIVQDADRLDGIGAIGIARCFATAGAIKRSFYNLEDPFCRSRLPNDQEYTVDHFYQKLFKTADGLKTKSARSIAASRMTAMASFMGQLSQELQANQ